MEREKEKIYFNYNEFKDNFQRDFLNYKEVNNFHDALPKDFAVKQKTLYEWCIKNITIIYHGSSSIYEADLEASENSPYGIIDEVQEKVNFNEQLSEKYNQTFSRIIEYLNKIIDSDIENLDIDEANRLPEIDLTSQKEQIRLMFDLGIIKHLQSEYPHLKSSNNLTSNLISKILKLKNSSIQPSINDLLNNNNVTKNYPKETLKTKAIIDKLKSNELI